MPYDLKIILGSAGALIGLSSYVPYYRDIFRGRTKPHPFSWFVWGLVSSIAFFAQISSDGGIGAWATGVTSLACFSIALSGVFFGEKHITTLDVISFTGALAGIIIWRETHDPFFAVVLMVAVHTLGFVPTFRKAYLRPYEETLLTYILSLFKWGFGLLALSSFTPTTALFPAAIFTMNSTFSLMLFIRRKQLTPTGTLTASAATKLSA